MDPSSIGRYQIVRRLGRGGMGALFLARDPAIDRLVAIKMLREDLDNEDLLARFEREARLAGRLHHPNIVTIFDVGTEGGRPFIAMEYITGDTVQAIIQERRQLSVARRLGWIEHLCAGLHYAHRAGTIHRDIKPANLMIDAEGQLKILDFGIARRGGSEMTQIGMVVGTLNYMAPEQMESRAVDARADVFCVGAVAYELLSYERAFPGDVPGEVMRKKLTGTFEPLAVVSPSLDGDIVSIVTRCLENDPANRWSDLDTVRQQLAAIRRRIADDVGEADATKAWGIAPAPMEAAPATLASRREIDRQRLVQIRSDKIAERLQQAREALGRGDFAAVLESCREARVLDPDDPAAIELEEQVHAALEQQQVDTWIREARSELDRGALTAAVALADRALALKKVLPEAVAIKQAVRDARRRLAEERERATARGEAVAKARQYLDESLFEDALSHVETALAIDPVDREAAELKQQILDARQRADDAAAAARAVVDTRLAIVQALTADVAAGSDTLAGPRTFVMPRREPTVHEEQAATPAGVAAALSSPPHEVEPRPLEQRSGYGRTLIWAAAAIVIAVASVVVFQRWGPVAGPVEPVASNGGLAAANAGAGSTADIVPPTDGQASVRDDVPDGSPTSVVSTTSRAGSSNTGTPPAQSGSLRSKVEPAKPQRTDSGSRGASESQVAVLGSIQATQAACERGDGGMCFELGVSYRTGRGAGVDDPRATSLFERACDDGFARGCNAVGMAYARGLGAPRDDARAAAFYQRGCDNGYGSACVNLGRMYEAALGVPKDDGRASGLFVRGCDGGDGAGCNDAGRMYELGRGVARDGARAATLYQRACASGYAPGCSGLGWMYFRGVGIDRDDARAVALFRQACDAGNPAGCTSLGLAYFQGQGVAKDVKRAAQLYQQSCDKDGPPACTNLGLMYLRGQDVPRDDERAATLFRRACDRDHAGGCFNLGFVYATGRGVMKDESRAVTLYQRACDRGIGDACTRAASMYEQGLGVAADRARAAALYQRGRDLIGGDTTQRPPPPRETRADGGASGDARAGTGAQPLRVGGTITAPTRLRDVRPTYPVAAQYARVQGAVTLEATIGPAGNVVQTKILQSIPLLDGAAEDAVKQWRYTPTIVDGKAVPVLMSVTVNFSLQDGAPK